MAIEIERKFLLAGDGWKISAQAVRLRQGYLSSVKERTVRIRTIDDKGCLTIKGIAAGASRSEYEYEIPFPDAEAMLAELCEKPLIEKNRYRVKVGAHLWEVDEFFGENLGLVVAEVELKSEDEVFEKPQWVGREVTSDSRYFNSNLVKNPFRKWRQEVE